MANRVANEKGNALIVALIIVMVISLGMAGMYELSRRNQDAASDEFSNLTANGKAKIPVGIWGRYHHPLKLTLTNFTIKT